MILLPGSSWVTSGQGISSRWDRIQIYFPFIGWSCENSYKPHGWRGNSVGWKTKANLYLVQFSAESLCFSFSVVGQLSSKIPAHCYAVWLWVIHIEVTWASGTLGDPISSASVFHICAIFSLSRVLYTTRSLRHDSPKPASALFCILDMQVWSGNCAPSVGTSCLKAVGIHWDAPTQYSQEAWKALLVVFILVELQQKQTWILSNWALMVIAMRMNAKHCEIPYSHILMATFKEQIKKLNSYQHCPNPYLSRIFWLSHICKKKTSCLFQSNKILDAIPRFSLHHFAQQKDARGFSRAVHNGFCFLCPPHSYSLLQGRFSRSHFEEVACASESCPVP